VVRPPYAITVAFLVSTMMFVAGVVVWWPLAAMGAVLIAGSCLAAVLHSRRRAGFACGLRAPRAGEAWNGLMR
jgi:hypothetical protein